jgi:catechol 2,3-dioxygenase-like lactoylglutathione lyase family enzyme
MDWKIELVAIPVTDVDRAKAFYVEQAGFHADHDHQVNDALRFVQLSARAETNWCCPNNPVAACGMSNGC